MTRSEEELDITTSRREAGRARLHKWIETEDVQITVPVRREKARLVTEALAGDEIDVDGADLADGQRDVVLSEEVIDVTRRVVPKERVRLETETETVDVAVDDVIRKERIHLDDIHLDASVETNPKDTA